jgi:hypothetical protein
MPSRMKAVESSSNADGGRLLLAAARLQLHVISNNSNKPCKLS